MCYDEYRSRFTLGLFERSRREGRIVAIELTVGR